MSEYDRAMEYLHKHEAKMAARNTNVCPTLHDLYTMAALTGYRANPSIIQDGPAGFAIACARADADAAMAAGEGK